MRVSRFAMSRQVTTAVKTEASAANADTDEGRVAPVLKRLLPGTDVAPGITAKFPIVIGSVAIPLEGAGAAAAAATQHRATHEWVCYVADAPGEWTGQAAAAQGDARRQPSTGFLHSVEFELHESFGRQRVETVTTPPFAIVRQGWDDARVVIIARLLPDGINSIALQHTVRLQTPLWHIPTLSLGGKPRGAAQAQAPRADRPAVPVVGHHGDAETLWRAPSTNLAAAAPEWAFFADATAPCVVEVCDYVLVRCPPVASLLAGRELPAGREAPARRGRGDAGSAPSGPLSDVLPARFWAAREAVRARVVAAIASRAGSDVHANGTLPAWATAPVMVRLATASAAAAAGPLLCAAPILALAEFGVAAGAAALDHVIEHALSDAARARSALHAAVAEQAAALADMQRGAANAARAGAALDADTAR